MKFAVKLFDFKGSPVYLKYWFFILLLLIPVGSFVSVFIAVLLHEMAHMYVAKKLNYKVGSIQIDLFHGSAEVGHISDHKDNILVTAAGPLCNLLLVLFSYLIRLVLPDGIAHDLMDTMIYINGLLFVFNILPIFPMDGGRISKSILSLIFGNMRGMFYNGILSLVSSGLLFAVSVACGMPILAIFSLLFAYFSYKEIELSR